MTLLNLGGASFATDVHIEFLGLHTIPDPDTTKDITLATTLRSTFADNAIVFFTSLTAASGSSDVENTFTADLTTASNVRITRTAANGGTSQAACLMVMQFPDGYLASLNYYERSGAGTVAITSVDTDPNVSTILSVGIRGASKFDSIGAIDFNSAIEVQVAGGGGTHRFVVIERNV